MHEDRALVERLRRRAFAVVATDTIRVLTSGRTHARAPQGFAAYLRSLGRELPAAGRAPAAGLAASNVEYQSWAALIPSCIFRK